MHTVFTDHVRTLDPRCYPDEAFWASLRRALFKKMHERQLADAPPDYLGPYGATSWKDENVVFDLLLDCYTFAFLDRLDSLQEFLSKPGHDNVDGLIHRNIDNFLTDRQRRHDPFGYAAFKNVEGAVKLGIESGALVIVAPKREPIRIRNKTIVAIAGAEAAKLSSGESIAEVLDSLEPWQAALPKLFRVNVEVQRELQVCWRVIGSAGVTSFYCGNLTNAAKPAARSFGAAWHASGGDDVAWEADGQGGVALVKLVHPPDDDPESWSRLVDAMSGEIDKIQQLRVRNRVRELFQLLVISAVLRTDRPLPSQAELSRRLDVPKSTVSESYQRIRDMYEKLRTPSTSV